MMTPEQKKEIKKIDSKLKELFSDFYGSIKFNLTPNSKKTNINVIENQIE